MARTKSEAINIVSKKPAKSRSPSPSRTSEHSTPRSNSRSKSPEQSKVTSKDGKKRAKKTSRHFHTYNYRVLKQVHPDSGLNGHAAQILDSMMQNLARRLSDTALLVAHNNNSKTAAKYIGAPCPTLIPDAPYLRKNFVAKEGGKINPDLSALDFFSPLELLYLVTAIVP